jgi:hypothetical protein
MALPRYYPSLVLNSTCNRVERELQLCATSIVQHFLMMHGNCLMLPEQYCYLLHLLRSVHGVYIATVIRNP